MGRDFRGTRQQRGYGVAHFRLKAKVGRVVEAGDARCVFCRLPIVPGSKWHLDHTPDRLGYRGPAHPGCNVRDANRRRAAKTRRRGGSRLW